MIVSAEEERGFQYEWILRTRTDTVFFDDIGAIVAASEPDRVYVPRNGMSNDLSQRCQQDLIFWCPRHLCRPYFTVLELFDSPHCQGASRELDVDRSAAPSVFAERVEGEWTPNGVEGPPSSDFWLPYAAQTGPTPRVDTPEATDVHYEADWWFLARYSNGARCRSFQDTQCCGAVDDHHYVRFALAQFNQTGNPSFIDCEARLLVTMPMIAEEEAELGITAEDEELRMQQRIERRIGSEAFEACMDLSQMWTWSNNTDNVPDWRDVHKGPAQP